MKILIVGENINTILLAKFINIQNPDIDIYITQKDGANYDFCTAVDIRESDTDGLLNFVKYNQIEFTITMSEISVINGIEDEFKKESFTVFAPCAQAARVTYFNSIAKKIMYKLKIPTPKFGIFDRENLAIDYVRSTKLPVIVENDFTLLERKSNLYKTFSSAKIGIQKMFETGNEKIVIENFIDEPCIYLYFITDGYSAFPLINIERSEYENFMELRSNSNKLSDEMTVKILQSVIYPLLDDIAKFSKPYTGILGLKIKIKKNYFYIYEFYNNFQKYDFQVFLSVLNENIFDLLYDTVVGSLADNRNFVETDSNYSYSAAVNKKFILNPAIDDENLFITEDNEYVIYTLLKPTMNTAENALIEALDGIVDNKILDEIKNNKLKKELRI